MTRQLAAESPTVSDYRVNLGERLYNLALFLNGAGQNEQSVAAYREAIAVFRKLAEELPQIPLHRRTLAMCLGALPTSLKEMGKLEEAVTASAESVAILRRLVKEDPKTPQYREELASTLDKHGVHLSAVKKWPDAIASSNEAITVFEKLVQDVPDEPHYGEELARALDNQVALLIDHRDYAKGLLLLDRARPLLAAALKANPNYSQYQVDTSDQRAISVRCLAGMGKIDEALAAADAIVAHGWKPIDDCYNSACALAQCVAIINAQDAVPAEKRAEQARLFSEHAVSKLKLAAQKGFTNAAGARRDDDLRSLRGRQDFEAVLAEIEAKAPKKK